MSNKKFDLFSRLGELPSRLYFLLAVAALVLHTALCSFTDLSPTHVGITVIALYAGSALIVFIVTRKKLRRYRLEFDTADAQSNGVIRAFREDFSIPYVVIDPEGRILTVNDAMREAAGAHAVFRGDLEQLCGVSAEAFIHASELEDTREDPTEETGHERTELLVTLGERHFRPECHAIRSNDKTYYMIALHDVTDLLAMTALHRDEQTAIAYIILDNLEEIAQYVKVSYQAEASHVGSVLKDWASSFGGVLREYERNKYVMLLSQKALDTCMQNKFDILDTVREIRIGEDRLPITISMGLATTGANLTIRERDALVALDTALQRGGDQAVLRTATGLQYFGGRTKSQQKRIRSHSRIIAGKLCAMIQNASNVLVMGHASPDFDSIGACVGIAALAMHLGVDVKIVTDVESDAFRSCAGRLCELHDYRDVFVDGVVGLAESGFGTLLIVVDANNFAILEAPEIAAGSFKTVVIDHHIKKGDFENEPQMTYIDPSASSACELITEILEQTLPVGTLRKEEAHVMMAGIMVDTQNFTRTVGTRTFAAALYLRAAGGSSEVARTYFEAPFEDYTAEARFGAEAHVYRDRFAITAITGSGSSTDRIAAAKAADKLLSVRGVSAAFAMILIGQTVHISARSDGSVNVQLILEKIGGGGHFDVAGAALADSTLDAAEARLCAAIDEYFEDTNTEKK